MSQNDDVTTIQKTILYVEKPNICDASSKNDGLQYFTRLLYDHLCEKASL